MGVQLFFAPSKVILQYNNRAWKCSLAMWLVTYESLFHFWMVGFQKRRVHILASFKNSKQSLCCCQCMAVCLLVTDDKSVRVKFPPQEADYTCTHNTAWLGLCHHDAVLEPLTTRYMMLHLSNHIYNIKELNITQTPLPKLGIKIPCVPRHFAPPMYLLDPCYSSIASCTCGSREKINKTCKAYRQFSMVSSNVLERYLVWNPVKNMLEQYVYRYEKAKAWVKWRVIS